jgi:hypothetical protein
MLRTLITTIAAAGLSLLSAMASADQLTDINRPAGSANSKGGSKMATEVRGTVQEQPWTKAFTQNAASAFEAALAPDVRFIASALTRPIVGRDLVKMVMVAASASYERLVFTDQVRTDKRAWLEWEARTHSGLEFSGVTVLTMNDKGEIAEVSIHHRPLPMLLKFSAELGDQLIGKVDRSYFYQPEASAPLEPDAGAHD